MVIFSVGSVCLFGLGQDGGVCEKPTQEAAALHIESVSYFRKPRATISPDGVVSHNLPILETPPWVAQGPGAQPPGVNQSPLSLIMQVDCVMFKWISWDFYGEEDQHPIKS